MQNKSKREKAERAKIFLPYDTLKGFREALREKERVIVAKRLLSKEEKLKLNRKLTQIKKMSVIKVVYYDSKEYVELEGIVSKIDIEYERCLYIKQQRILFTDLLALSADYLNEDEF